MLISQLRLFKDMYNTPPVASLPLAELCSISEPPSLVSHLFLEALRVVLGRLQNDPQSSLVLSSELLQGTGPDTMGRESLEGAPGSACIGVPAQGGDDSSVGKVLAMRAWGPEFKSHGKCWVWRHASVIPAPKRWRHADA